MLALAVVVYAPGDLTFRPGVSTLFQAGIGSMAILSVALRVGNVARDRLMWSLFGAAVVVDVIGLVAAQALAGAGTPLGPGVQAFLVASFPLLYVALLLSLRSRLGALGWGLALDGLVSGLGVAAVAIALVQGPLRGDLAAGTAGDALAVVQVVGASAVLTVVLVSWAVTSGRPDPPTAWVALGALAHLVAGVVLLAAGSPAPHVEVLAFAAGHVCYGFVPWARERAVPAGARPGVALVLPALSLATTATLLALADGRHLPLLSTVLGGLALLGAGGRIGLLHRDLVKLAASRAEAETDELTRLGNRRLLRDRLGQALGGRAEHEQVAVLLIDLDRFKDVNDSLGHHAGDELLRVVASRLRQAVGPMGTLARLGGDEFAVLVGPTEEARAEAQCLADELLDRLRRPFRVQGAHVTVDASIGLSVCPADGQDAQELMRRADAAMYRAKASRTGTASFVAELDEAAGHLALAEDLRRALGEHQLAVHYQPVVDLGTGRVERVEALVRWRHPTRGLLAPGDFLGLAERAGLVDDLLRFVLGDALANVAAWRAEGLTGRVAVNLSVAELGIPRLHALVGQQLRERQVPPEALELEVPEDSLGVDLEQSLTVLQQLKLAGVRLVVDDYGSGKGSLALLRRLPLSAVKLDRAFVTALAVDPENQAIVQATAGLARALALELVAEGVEAPAALPLLRDLGCDAAQGVAICPPIEAAQLTQWLRRQVARHTADALHQ